MACEGYLQEKKWKGTPTCPHCGEVKVYRFADNIRFKCSSCKRHFNARTGTIFEGSKVGLRKWLIAIYLITGHKKGVSSHQLAKDLGVTQKTAWFMLHRIRWALQQGTFDKEKLYGDVEIDETFIGGKNKNRHAKKKLKNSQGGAGKVPVLGIIKRGGELRAFKVKSTNIDNMRDHIFDNIHRKSLVYTDEHSAYCNLKYAFYHQVVNHNRGEYVNGEAYTNTLEGFWALLKRSIFGIYHVVSPKHVQRYVDEAVFRYNTKCDGEFLRLDKMLEMMGRRLKYDDLIKGYD